MHRLLVAGLLGLFLLATPAVAYAAGSETYRQLNLFGDVFERVRADYVEEVSDTELIEAAIKGMLSSLDPHSSYLNPDSFKKMQEQTRGEFGGLGIEVSMENGFVKVIAPIEDTPAFRAGIKPGDLITHLDGESVLGLTLNDAVEKMRGPVNTDITITVSRLGIEEPFDVTIKRAKIKVGSVRHRTEGKAAYIRITAFSEQTEGGVKAAMKALKKELGDELQGVILDLRGNPGGLLDQAVAVADAFLDQGEIVSTRGRREQDSKRYNANKGDISNGKPVVVLINGGSASASEIVAGAMQDHNRAIVMGTKSFGKGSVQTIMPLAGRGAIRLTTSLYYTPSGVSIQAKGIEPDIIVEQARLEPIDAGPARSEASLRNHLGGTDEEGDVEGDAEGEEAVSAAVSPDSESFDYQLSRAIDLLRGISLSANRYAE